MPMPTNVAEYNLDGHTVSYVNGVTVTVSRDGESGTGHSMESENDAFAKAVLDLDGTDEEKEAELVTHLVHPADDGSLDADGTKGGEPPLAADNQAADTSVDSSLDPADNVAGDQVSDEVAETDSSDTASSRWG